MIGGNTPSDCNLGVDIIARSPTQTSRSTVWTAPDTLKATGSDLGSPVWRHATIELPASRLESQVVVRSDLRPGVGAAGVDNIVYSTGTKCSPRLED